MKTVLLALTFLLPAGAASNPALSEVRTVYILPMTSAIDQYLANHITTNGLFQVVTDPAKADAIFSDQMGAGFERRLKELFPPEPVSKEEQKKADKEDDRMLKGEAQITPPSTFSRGKGNIFLIDHKTHNVLWSIYERPKSGASDELDKTSAKVVSRLKNDLKAK
ncbi:MAG: hypothetical protein JJE04_03160 [Acidobacteriia bacterium]|nr:hypothetical protein [Terriglobia bacterium]